MPVLFTISILALIALLWASISIARHVRRARLRHRRASADAARSTAGFEPSAMPQAAHEVSFTELAPLATPLVSRKIVQPPVAPLAAPLSKPLELWVEPTASAAEPFVEEPLEISESPEAVAALPDQPAAIAPKPAFARTDAPAEPPAQAAAIEIALPVAEPVLAAESMLPVAEVSVAPQPTKATPFTPIPQEIAEPAPEPEPHPVVISQPFGPPVLRTDWAYFNKDMGDLSDPVPNHPKLRPRTR